MQRLTRDQIAARVAQDIHEGAYVNLGIGLPTMVANHLPADREVFLQSENGLLGMGPAPAPGEEDEDLINAGKQPVTLLKGGSYFHHADSFAMMRGGHLDICVLGAFQVSAKGDLANWHTGAKDAIPAVGGAMDLAIGARQVFVMMEHQTRQGDSKIVEQCSYPLTGVGLRLAHLHRPGSDRCHRRWPGGARNGRRPDLRRTANDYRRTAAGGATMNDAFICDAIRTPIGRYGGAFKDIRADDLGAVPLRALIARHPHDGLGGRAGGAVRLRQPGRRRQPQRGAHVGPAGRPAAADRRQHHQSPVRFRHGRRRHRRARDQVGRSATDDRRRRRIDDARAVRHGQGGCALLAPGVAAGHHHRLALRQSADGKTVRRRQHAADGGERRHRLPASAAPTRTCSRCAARTRRRAPSRKAASTKRSRRCRCRKRRASRCW